MNPATETKLREKGWTSREIDRANQLLHEIRPHDVHFFKIVLWSALIVIVFGNLLVSVILVPFLGFTTSWILFLLVIILGGMIGFLYNFLITDIGILGKKHHIMAGILVPLLALVNMILMVFLSHSLAPTGIEHNPFIVGGVFAIAFILPYLIDQVRMWVKRES